MPANLIPGYIHIKADTGTFTNHIVIGIFTLGEESAVIIAMYAYIKHIRVRFEDMLCAVAMMHVPVNN